jgi:hypothetical protein
MNPDPPLARNSATPQFLIEKRAFQTAEVYTTPISVSLAAAPKTTAIADPKREVNSLPCCSRRVPTKLDGWGLQDPTPVAAPIAAPVPPAWGSVPPAPPKPKQTYTPPKLSGMGQAQLEAEQRRERERDRNGGRTRGREPDVLVVPEVLVTPETPTTPEIAAIPVAEQQPEQIQEPVFTQVPKPKPASIWSWGQKATPQTTQPKNSGGAGSATRPGRQGKSAQSKGPSSWRWGSSSKQSKSIDALDVEVEEEDDDSDED